MPPVVVFVYIWKCLDHAEGTNSKSEVTQTYISAPFIKYQVLEITKYTSLRFFLVNLYRKI
jgi:hypothetical protein